MRRLRYLLLAAVVLLGLGINGCVLTSAQIFAHFDLPDPFEINSVGLTFQKIDVDLNTIDDYAKHKKNLKHLSDAAIGGVFTNVSGPAGAVEVWMTPDPTSYSSVGQIQANAIKLWGPASIGPTGSVVKLTWDQSAKLFTSAGRQALIDQVKGDGQFTIYTIGTSGTYDIRVDHGTILLVIDAGI